MIEQLKQLSTEELREFWKILSDAQQPTEEEREQQRQKQEALKAEREEQMRLVREAKMDEVRAKGYALDGSLEDHIKLCGCPKKAENRWNTLDETARVNDILTNAE